MPNKYVWATDCPVCRRGIVALLNKGGIADCQICGSKFTTDFEEHPELGMPETEYWIVELIEAKEQP